MLEAIDSKAKRLWGSSSTRSYADHSLLNTADMISIQKIVARSLKRLG